MNEPQAEGSLGSAANRVAGWLAQVLRPGARGATPAQDQTQDWVLWQAACAGDARSATRLVQHLTPQAYALAMQLLARHEDAEDAVQEAFVRLWASRPSDARGATLATYFNTIVINRCKSRLVRRREFSAAPDELVELADAQQRALPCGDGTHAVDAVRIQAALARLAPRQRMALAMWAYADADIGDIARTMELEPNAAHQLLHRAKAALRLQLREPPP